MLPIDSVLMDQGCREEIDFGQFSNFSEIVDIPQKIAASIVSIQLFCYSKRT